MAIDMRTVIEATSLQSVTDVAANPPLDPCTLPPSDAHPLVLYIARVPGSRDVFLTPMKPREKVVSAEDVQSCLYFVHVNTGIDDIDAEQASLAPRPDRTSAQSDDTVSLSRLSMLARRPVPPASPPYRSDDIVAPNLPPRRSPASPHHRISRKPIAINQPQSSDPLQDLRHLPVLPPRPLPSPPAEPCSSDSLHLGRTLSQLDDTATPPRLETGTLTLIRRDPGSGAQWNVAAIHDPAVPEISSGALKAPTAARRTKKGGAPLYLDISNPGYAPFAALEPQIPACAASDGDAWPAPQGTFRRRLYLPGSRHGEHGYATASQQRPKHASVHSLSSVDLSADDAPARADRRGKSYTFASPWSGTCEFDSGTSGCSLKCRHTQLIDQGSTASAQRRIEEDVSELRFNLPAALRSTVSEDGGGDKWKKRASLFVPHRRNGSTDEPGMASDDTLSLAGSGSAADELAGRIDLSLGRERAGGGFGGKQAKLGKLIVQPAGLKMLDLLVAANVGLWWRAYERA